MELIDLSYSEKSTALLCSTISTQYVDTLWISIRHLYAFFMMFDAHRYSGVFEVLDVEAPISPFV